MSVNQRVKRIRLSTGLGQVAFAQSINASKSGVDRYEKEGHEVPLSIITALIKTYNIHPDWLMFGDGGEDIRYKNDFVEKEKYESIENRLMAVQEELIRYQKKELEELRVEKRAEAQK